MGRSLKLSPIMSLAEEGQPARFLPPCWPLRPRLPGRPLGGRGNGAKSTGVLAKQRRAPIWTGCVDISAPSLDLLICKQGFQRQVQRECETG